MGNDNYEERRGDHQHITEEKAVEFLRQQENSRMMSMVLSLGTSRQIGCLASPYYQDYK